MQIIHATPALTGRLLACWTDAGGEKFAVILREPKRPKNPADSRAIRAFDGILRSLRLPQDDHQLGVESYADFLRPHQFRVRVALLPWLRRPRRNMFLRRPRRSEQAHQTVCVSGH